MVVGMHVDHNKLAWRVVPVENADLTAEVPNSPIVNVDANFVVPVEQQHEDFVFPRLTQAYEMARIAERHVGAKAF